MSLKDELNEIKIIQPNIDSEDEHINTYVDLLYEDIVLEIKKAVETGDYRQIGTKKQVEVNLKYETKPERFHYSRKLHLYIKVISKKRCHDMFKKFGHYISYDITLEERWKRALAILDSKAKKEDIALEFQLYGQTFKSNCIPVIKMTGHYSYSRHLGNELPEPDNVSLQIKAKILF